MNLVIDDVNSYGDLFAKSESEQGTLTVFYHHL